MSLQSISQQFLNGLGNLPVDWKLVNIVAIVKQSKEDGTGNYRSVSLTAVTGKIMEKIILESAEKHLKYNAVL